MVRFPGATRLFLTILSVLALQVSAQLTDKRIGSSFPKAYLVSPEEPAKAEGEARDTRQRIDEAAARVDEEERSMGRQYDRAFRQRRIRELAAKPETAGEKVVPVVGISLDSAENTSADLVYTPVAPCRIIDTRVVGGIITAGSVRDFKVAGTELFEYQGGTAGGCGVPLGPATVAHINLVAVAAEGAGNLRAWAWGGIESTTTSIINYQMLSPNLNVANAVNVPLCSGGPCTSDLTVRSNISAVHVVADVLGYFRPFPKEQVRSFTVRNRTQGVVAVQSTCTPYWSIQIDAPVAGRVTVRAIYGSFFRHTIGTDSRVIVSISADEPGICHLQIGWDNYVEVVSAAVSGDYTPPLVSLSKTFDVAPGTHTFYLNGFRHTGAEAFHFWAGMEAQFEPN